MKHFFFLRKMPHALKSEYSNIFQDQMLRICFSVADIVDLLSHSTAWTHAPSHYTQRIALAWRGDVSGTGRGAVPPPQHFSAASVRELSVLPLTMTE